MMIAPGQLIAGRPALEVRDIMRRMRERGYTCLGLARELRVDEMTASRLLADLLNAGLVERCDAVVGTIVVGEAEQGQPVHALELFASAVAGNALAKARTGRKMPRKEAYELLQGVIDRAEGVNHDDTWLHWVIEVVLYGSLATDSDDPVGDVDVGVRFVPRFAATEYHARQDALIAQDGASPRSVFALVGYAQVKLLRHLRSRSRRIDLDDIGGVPPGATRRTVYTFEPPQA